MRINRRNGASTDSLQIWKQILRAHNYPEASIASTATKLEAMPDTLKKALLDWHETGDLADLSVEGISTHQLMGIFGFAEIAAILMLDWLLREPDEAKYALAQPVTRVVVDDKVLEAIECAEMEDSGDSDATMNGE